MTKEPLQVKEINRKIGKKSTKEEIEMAKKYMGDCRTWMAIQEMQIKARASCHFHLSAWQRPVHVSVFAQPAWNTTSLGGR